MDTREDTIEGNENGAGPEKLQESIAHQRRKINHTLNEIGERLRPKQLLDSFLGAVEGTPVQRAKQGVEKGLKNAESAVESAAGKAYDIVADNILPILVIGAGSAWWAYNTTRGKGSGEQPGEAREVSSGKMQLYGPEGTPIADIDRESERPSGRESSPGEEIHLERARGAFESEKSDTLTKAREGMSSMIDREKLESTKESISQKADAVRQKASWMGDISQKITGASRTETGSKLSGVRDRISRRVSKVGERVSRLGEKVKTRRQTAGSISERIKSSTMAGKRNLKDSFSGAPFAFGIGLLAGGFLLGLLIPATRKEKNLMGESSHRFESNIKGAGQQLFEKGKAAAGAAAGALKEELRRTGHELKDELTEESHHLVQHVTEAAKEGAGKIPSDKLDGIMR